MVVYERRTFFRDREKQADNKEPEGKRRTVSQKEGCGEHYQIGREKDEREESRRTEKGGVPNSVYRKR